MFKPCKTLTKFITATDKMRKKKKTTTAKNCQLATDKICNKVNTALGVPPCLNNAVWENKNAQENAQKMCKKMRKKKPAKAGFFV